MVFAFTPYPCPKKTLHKRPLVILMELVWRIKIYRHRSGRSVLKALLREMPSVQVTLPPWCVRGSRKSGYLVSGKRKRYTVHTLRHSGLFSQGVSVSIFTDGYITCHYYVIIIGYCMIIIFSFCVWLLLRVFGLLGILLELVAGKYMGISF